MHMPLNARCGLPLSCVVFARHVRRASRSTKPPHHRRHAQPFRPGRTRRMYFSDPRPLLGDSASMGADDHARSFHSIDRIWRATRRPRELAGSGARGGRGLTSFVELSSARAWRSALVTRDITKTFRPVFSAACRSPSPPHAVAGVPHAGSVRRRLCPSTSRTAAGHPYPMAGHPHPMEAAEALGGSANIRRRLPAERGAPPHARAHTAQRQVSIGRARTCIAKPSVPSANVRCLRAAAGRLATSAKSPAEAVLSLNPLHCTALPTRAWPTLHHVVLLLRPIGCVG